MTSKTFLGLVVAILTASGALKAQAQVQNNPLTVLSTCATMMGAPNAEQSIAAHGVLMDAATQESHTVVMKTQGSRHFRQEETSSEGVATWVVKDGGGFHSKGDQRKAIASHSTRYFRPDHLPALACAFDAARFDATLEGAAQVSNKATYHVKLVAKPASSHTKGVEAVLSEYHVFIDQQTFLVLKTSTFVFSPDGIQNRSTWETFYDDYRKVGGVFVPFHIENYLSGKKIRDIVFSDVQAGASFSSAEFN